MCIGSKSLLYGCHQFLIHPLIVAFCYWKLYGFPWNPQLWLCFFLHDVGYLGCVDMDGKYGRYHPGAGMKILKGLGLYHAAYFCVLHSRFIAEKLHSNVSRLGIADKLAVVYTPVWMYSSAELDEYVNNEDMDIHTIALYNIVAKAIDIKYKIPIWKDVVNKKCLRFVYENKDTALKLSEC